MIYYPICPPKKPNKETEREVSGTLSRSGLESQVPVLSLKKTKENPTPQSGWIPTAAPQCLHSPL